MYSVQISSFYASIISIDIIVIFIVVNKHEPIMYIPYLFCYKKTYYPHSFGFKQFFAARLTPS